MILQGCKLERLGQGTKHRPSVRQHFAHWWRLDGSGQRGMGIISLFQRIGTLQCTGRGRSTNRTNQVQCKGAMEAVRMGGRPV
jgi:hypothetical protein